MLGCDLIQNDYNLKLMLFKSSYKNTTTMSNISHTPKPNILQ